VSGDWVYIHSTLSRETGVPQLVMRQPLRSQAGPITSVFAGTDERQLSDEAFGLMQMYTVEAISMTEKLVVNRR
jgi:hypothetical protein